MLPSNALVTLIQCLSLFASGYRLGGSLRYDCSVRATAAFPGAWNQVIHTQHIQPKPTNLLDFFQHRFDLVISWNIRHGFTIHPSMPLA